MSQLDANTLLREHWHWHCPGCGRTGDGRCLRSAVGVRSYRPDGGPRDVFADTHEHHRQHCGREPLYTITRRTHVLPDGEAP